MKMMKKKAMGGKKKRKPAKPKSSDNDATAEEKPVKDNEESDDDNGEDDSKSLRDLVVQHNKKKKKSGGFQSMGLDAAVLRGVTQRGYRVPTPIQRRAVPLILEGRDVVAMARTGSGKTAAFLVPLFQRLKTRSARAGARALVLSPTKELATQTRKFCGQLGKYTGLRAACVLGGESMERQFALMHENPDIIIATPGRFMHVCVEMGLKLDSIEYVVFDEADRLFEMGFGEQLREVLSRLPAARQTLLFSATLPKLLVDFARAGLSDPTLVRLDVDSKIPETLRLAFCHCRPEGRSAALLHLLERVLPREQQAVVFCATRHHVEYLHLLLQAAGVDSTFVYSHLDPTARKINVAKFAARKCRVMLVTDLAARGIDMPFLDNVINYHFPSQAKLFVHRVGRVARAGRTGTAYSLVAGDELAYFIDLQLFLGRSVSLVPKNFDKEKDDWHNMLGAVPASVNDEYADQLQTWHEDSLDLRGARDVADRGFCKYLKSRPGASAESVKRSKKMSKSELLELAVHPLMAADSAAEGEADRVEFLERMKKFRPPATIFEIGNTTKSSQVRSVMASKRNMHGAIIEKTKLSRGSAENEDSEDEDKEDEETKPRQELQESSEADITSAFGKVVSNRAVKSAKVFKAKKRKRPAQISRDEENYIGYSARDHHTEAGYSVSGTGFEAEASGAAMDLAGDDDVTARAKRNVVRWDAKKKKYVKDSDASGSTGGNKKRIKTESGVWIQASYKSDRYARWKEKSKLAQMQEQEEDREVSDGEAGGGGNKMNKGKRFRGLPASHPAMKKARQSGRGHPKGPKRELRRPEEVLKQRKAMEKRKNKNAKKGKGGGRGRGR